MSRLIRHFSPNRIYFITTVTHRRAPLLIENFDLLQKAVNNSRRKDRFTLLAWAVLPDHIHLLVNPHESSPSDIIHRIKLSFGSHFRKRHGFYRVKVWQDRFWDHVIRDQEDFYRHIDYIHYNPVKHGLVTDPFDWQRSSIDSFHERGYYARDWGVVSPREFVGDYGE